ncbi:unnamed protein product [Orchesella dallaii]|uniref:Carboxylic ester hydrolase n=1 Tax=Orchesella dallaii TaxID=48710 RepID=A0ABP1PST8_9HEXA
MSSLGFLSTGDGLIKGNMGLWDQNLAFRWLKDNIEQFGGDPERITIFGESAGGSSVHYHMLSPYSAGLFQKAISQSGTALQIWALSKHPKTQARKLARAMNCPINNSTIMISCLRGVDAKKLVQYHISSMSAIRENTDLFVPTVDGDFIPDNPIDLLRNGSFAKIPWMTGVNAGEGLLNTGRILASRKVTENIWQNWNKWIPLMLDYDPTRYDISWKIKQYYFSQLAGKPIGDSAIANFTAMYSDRVYFLDSKRAAMLHAKHAPVYLYFYSYPGEVSFFRLFKAVMPSLGDIMAPELKIAMDVTKDFIRKYLLRQPMKYLDIPCHADELILQFNTHRLIEINKNSRDYPVSKALVKSWADFAKSNFTLTYQNSQWPPVSLTDSDKLSYMHININGHMIPEPFTESTRFWESMGF